MSEIDLAWAAGLFEGEGCIAPRKTKHIQLQVTSTDRDVLERFQKVVGFGTIYNKTTQVNQTKPGYVWMATNVEQIEQLFESFVHHLGERRQNRFNEVLSTVKQERIVLGYKPMRRTVNA